MIRDLIRLYRTEAPADGGGKTVVIDNPPPVNPPAYTPPDIKIMDAAPPEYREKPYMKDVKDIPTMFKQFDELQTKLGQRPAVGVPAADAKPEDLDKFYGTLRPKDAKEYAFAPLTGADGKPVLGADGKPVEREAAAMDMIKGVFHEAGISSYQANKLLPGLEKFMVDYAKNKTSADDQAFEAAVTKQFGDQVEPSLKIAKDLIAAHVPAEYVGRLEKLPNDALLLLTVAMKGVHDKYIKEDGVTPPGGGGGAGGDVNALRAQALGLMSSAAYKDFRDPNHEATKKQVDDLYQKIAGFTPKEES